MCRLHNYAALCLTLLLLLSTFRLAASVESPETTYLHRFSEGLRAPIRIATDSLGNAYVTDTRRHRVCVMDASGVMLRHISGIAIPLGIAVDSHDRLYIGDRETGSVGIFTLEGAPTGKLGVGDGQFSMPTDIAIDSQGKIYVVDSKESCVKVFNKNGYYEFQFGDSTLAFPTGIAIDRANDTILVGQYGGIEDGTRAAKVQIFDMQGNWKNSIGRYGSKPGEFRRIQGIAVDGLGRIYVTDCFMSNVQVVDYDGNWLSYIGGYEANPGQLRLPSDVALDLYNRLWVTSTNNGAVELFGIDEYGSPVVQESRDSFTVDLVAGFNFTSVPLKPATEWRLSDLAAYIGDEVISIVTYIPEHNRSFCYLPGFPVNDSVNVPVKGNEGYIVIMRKSKSVTFQGTAWEGEVALPAGMSIFALPLQPSNEWRLSDLAEHIGDEARHIITHINTFETYTPGTDSSSNTIVDGGVGYIMVMSETKTVVFEGEAWSNKPSGSYAPGRYDAEPSDTPVLVVLGKALAPETGEALEGVRIQISDLSTGAAETVITNPRGDYAAAFIDFLGKQTATRGDTIQVKTADPRWIGEMVTYTLADEDIRMRYVTLPVIHLERVPKQSVLLPNYPNPLNPETWIPYRLSQDAEVSIEIYSLTGQLVRTLALGKKATGNYVSRQQAAYWDGTNEAGEAVASGVYFYVMRAGEFAATRRMTVTR